MTTETSSFDQTNHVIGERWLQIGYLNKNGNLIKTPLKFPFHTDLSIDQELTFHILGKDYFFTCVRDETVSNNSDTVDKIYVVCTTEA